MWTPLLSGSLAEEALTSARDIARSLLTLDEASGFTLPGSDGPDATLGCGASGVALALAHLAEADVFPEGRIGARRFLDLSTEIMASVRMNPSLLDGFTGIGWVARRLLPGSAEVRDADALSEMDAEVLALLVRYPWRSYFDLVSGLSGLGLYALDRLPRRAGREALLRIIEHLDEASERAGPGITWHTRPALLTPPQRRASPQGHYDLGLAHGIPGVIGLLGQVCASGVGECVPRARQLLSGAVAWLLKHQEDGPSRFGYFLGPGVVHREGRSAWCYGDPGVAAALFVAARGANEPSWEKVATEVAIHAARREPSTAGVVDCGLCHGAAGLGHIFNRFFQATGNPVFAAAATFWFERTLEMRRPGSGFAGYTTAVRLDEGELTYLSDPTLLTGAAGVALALSAACRPFEPEWDQVLMLSNVRGSRD